MWNLNCYKGNLLTTYMISLKTTFQNNSEDLFGPTPSASLDIEDIAGGSSSATGGNAIVTSNKRKRSEGTNDDEMSKSWRDILGPPPPMGTTKV